MSPQPLVSILINNYNYGRFLQTTIASALEQSYQPIEVIVVDDGSTDNSQEIIASFGDRIKAILKENGGQASAFNQGFASSQGEIICFLDSDDLFRPDKVAAIVHDFQKDQEIGWHFHNLELFGDAIPINPAETDINAPNFSSIYNLMSSMRRGKLSNTLPFKLNTATSAMSFRRSLLEKILPMNQNIRITSDDYIKYAALGISKGFISFQPLAKQRIHGNNAYTGNTKVGILKGLIQILTAANLKEKFPELSKFANNLAALAITIFWWLGDDKYEMEKLINNYLAKTTLPEKLQIYSKAIYYRHIKNLLPKQKK
ncbi:glycosyltransferase [Phormidium tenue]|uniref:Glycosyltransferase n=1 Tax=Phormidium tenue FACHB-1050 TaxID=2692857 RepID=A0ABR8CFN6_9CYAN|nr:glycosyltransferase [Phormidium tenue]MBD2319195.1 glycosyltransferase [Phormidium tenue FACHB-1050]